MVRSLQECAHETYMDCPFFEQLMYLGDTRLQVLASFVLSADDRLPRKALQMFDASRLNTQANNGLTQSRYPSRVRQWTRPFSLWHVAMLHDFALWRGDEVLVRDLLLGARSVLDSYARFLNRDGLIVLPPGPNFNFTDHVPGWGGEAPTGGTGTSAPVNWQWALVLKQAAELEDWFGAPEMAARWRRMARESAQAATRTFWNEERGCFADDPGHKYFSEHGQCLAILSGQLDSAMQERALKALLEAPDLSRATIYFSHYVLEVLAHLGNSEAFFARLEPWFELEHLGFKTTPEMPEPTRSDCHAWGAHPLYHFAASILGVRPASPGFETVRIAPLLGALDSASGTIPHPRGEISVHWKRENGELRGQISLPEGVSGTCAGQAIRTGTQSVTIR
jgi:hypothetical protein